MVKSRSAMQESEKMKVRSLGQEDPLEEGMATHPNILAWRIPQTEEPGRLHSPWVCERSNMTEFLHSVIIFIFMFLIVLP